MPEAAQATKQAAPAPESRQPIPGTERPQDGADLFQGLWDAGAFDPKGVPPKQAETPAPQEEPKPQAEPKAEPQGEPKSEPQAEPKGEEEYSDLDEFLAKNEIEPESFRSLPVKFKVDGRQVEVPLSDLIKNYGLEAHVTQKSQAIAEERRAFEEERQVARQIQAQQIQTAQAAAVVAQQMLNADFQGVDWNGLRAQNPAEYAARLADWQLRQGRINEVANAIEAQRQQEQQQQQQDLSGRVAQERQRMLDARPQWRDQGAFSKARERMVTYGKTLGFSDAELNNVLDHRMMLVLDHAAQYAELQASKPEALKRVRQAPKVAAPGARVNTNPKEIERQAALERFRANPKDQDAQAAVFGYLANA